jgi:hypothetical protein
MYILKVAAVQLAREVARISKGLKPLFPPPLSTGSSVISVFSPQQLRCSIFLFPDLLLL